MTPALIPQGADYVRILPEIVLTLFGMAIMVLDPLLDERRSQKILGSVGLAGAVSAMVTKGALAASVGAGVRQWIIARIPPRAVRYAGVSALLLLGLLSVIETLTESHG